MGKRTWTEEEIKILEEGYKNMDSVKLIAEKINRTEGSIKSKAQKLGLCDKYVRYNNPKFKADYQDYDWCYDKIINKNMTYIEIAKEYGYSVRVIEKWAREVYGISNRTYRFLKHPTDIQMELMMFGTIGDGHIDKRPMQPMYIESHAENQKDYLFWKYNILKDLCLNKPSYYPATVKYFNNKPYNCQPYYRMETRIIMDLDKIRKMSKSDIINKLNEFGLSVHMLDDASRSDALWSLCVAEYTDEEIELYLTICRNRFDIYGYVTHTNGHPYIKFRKNCSRKIDEIILRNIPNNLDIIKYKILKQEAA